MTSLLPESHCASVSAEKVLKYLLALEHPKGGSKARFFLAFGFQHSAWQLLCDALIVQGRTNPVVGVKNTQWGPRYEVLCNMPTPDGRNPCVRTVWQVSKNSSCPQLLCDLRGLCGKTFSACPS